jgi:hypothetical protein
LIFKSLSGLSGFATADALGLGCADWIGAGLKASSVGVGDALAVARGVVVGVGEADGVVGLAAGVGLAARDDEPPSETKTVIRAPHK